MTALISVLFWDITQCKVDFLTLEDRTDWLSQNVIKELPLHSA